MALKVGKKVLVIGSTVADLVAKSDSLPVLGKTILGKGFYMAPGGKGANQAAVVGRLKGDVSFISKIGEDYFGEYTLKHVRESGVDTSYVFIDSKSKSGVSLIYILENGENAIIMNPGANMKLEITEIDNLKFLFEQSCIFLVQLEIPLDVVFHSLKLAKQNGCLTILDPAPAHELSDEIYALSDIITPNETELSELTGISIVDKASIYSASQMMLEKGINAVICTRSDGAYLTVKNKETIFFPGIKVKAVDTTGAGDAFTGALANRLSLGFTIEESIEFANVTAGLSVQKMGAIPSFPTLEEVHHFFDLNKNLIRTLSKHFI